MIKIMLFNKNYHIAQRGRWIALTTLKPIIMMIDIDTLLAWGAAYKKVAANDIIFKEGIQAQFYYQLVSGSVRWVNINEEGKEFLQVMIEPGECFGELPLFDGGPFAATAVANEDSVVIRLHASTFFQLIKENPEIHIKFTRLLSERLRFKFFILKEMANHNPEHSISTLLSYFKETKTNICTKCNRIKLTRQQIADMTGLRVETVIRTIKNLQAKGQLVIEKGKVYC
ncbi:Crp/Fnr family transcriptional regulator [Ferruginibacter lapsinanis]|uniref:Crp/Fnr family transcriptional regulator n=1 Tax=Ferruginibacter lapsinanis TaxID=563172 RepID=UPI001E429A3A|nr:Crp/Fnr family transcriptional regulator [Ferruginibacter lapsinanis]UEG50140.1 Crp/Fnr family transcriptional regulator [Ferruginibacter lapsinanis]